jgi:C4-type Zn-finger protein
LSDAQLAFVEERRSTRIDRAIPLMVHGADLTRAPYQERVSTLTINCHGCKYRTKYQLLRGDVVFLEVHQPHNGSAVTSTRARVKWLHPLTIGDDRAFEVAVELEAPGNIWGVASPPHDWSAIQDSALGPVRSSALDSRAPASSQALQIVAAPDHATSLGQLMAGLGEQIQRMAADAATSVVAGEQSRMLDEFRIQLREEATRTLESVIAASKDEMVLRIWKELSERHDAAARNIYENWRGKVEKETETASRLITAHGADVSERVENMAVGTIERLQHSMDASRREAVDQCLSRLRSQLVPLLEEVQTARERLAAYEDELKVKGLAICKQFEDFMQEGADRSTVATRETLSTLVKQFDDSVSARIAFAQDEMGKKSAAAVDQSTQALRDLTQGCQSTAQTQLESMVKSAADRLNDELKERTAQISQQCSSELEDCTRSHLDFISEAIAEIAKKKANRLHD